MMVEAKAPACNCNNGAVMQEVPQCTCVCFGDFILPNCLYTVNDSINMELWLQSDIINSSVSKYERPPLSGEDIVSVLSKALGLGESDKSITFLQLKDDSFAVDPKEEKETKDVIEGNYFVIIILATVRVPGWAAQQLLADMAQNNTIAYTFNSSFTGISYTLMDVLEDASGPSLPVRYRDEYMGFYLLPDSSWYIVISNIGWFVGALLLAVFIPYLEQRYLYNMWVSAAPMLLHPGQKNPNAFANTKAANTKTGARPVARSNSDKMREQRLMEARRRKSKAKRRKSMKKGSVAEETRLYEERRRKLMKDAPVNSAVRKRKEGTNPLRTPAAKPPQQK
ncbi:uncharacterized protein TM35_000251300 [Trypanosoma theileri]|uniref:Uncharacterized protein n=1 Tax=Trypanosoma theileri TaxID=67003 RepID=A0A1X0NQ55_9TRYP|nr:uncharacterized protein TM35_000251300 [Trypanosoma theileri]ORC86834.1 hypothetical protein TM35_000251300 [Trypanosoma theileri]